MRRMKPRMAGVIMLLLVLSLIAAGCGKDSGESTTTAGGSSTTAGGTGEPIVIGDLAYYTGSFAPYGPALAAEAQFTFLEVINQDPPLGRPFEIIHEDIGTVGEGQAARKLVEQDKVDILLSPAHQYFTYRDWILGVVAEEDRPLMPTVHGGVIAGNIGGTAQEPLFRAQGLDEGLGVTDALYAESVGAKSVVIFATQVAGFQVSADAAEKACGELGIAVLGRIDAQGEMASYRTEAQRIVELKPDAVIVMASAVESGTLIKQAAEAGLSLYWIGESSWSREEFIATLTAAPIATQKAVVFPGFAAQTNTPAWAFFQPLWDGMTDYSQYTAATDSFAFTTYDLSVITALAIEMGGSTKASDWAPAMFKVVDPPGTVCYTYSECLGLLRSGSDIDYEGVTGPGTFSEHGVNAISPSVIPFNADGTQAAGIPLDAAKWIDILNKVAAEWTG
jgi:ABC-type branched-subunit amino acid transport system substrate-binding protein